MKLRNAETGRTIEYRARKSRGNALAATGGSFAPRILIFDIETTPMLSWHWRCYKENIAPVQIVKNSTLLCWAAKWLDCDLIHFDSIQKDKDDKRCSKTLWKLCDDADILVAHNGRAFDMSTLRTRWLKHGVEPPSPSKWVDTLTVARRAFNFSSNKLDGIARYLDMGTKHEHEGFGLWLRCMDGDKKAWIRMRDYNIQDVLLEEELYMKIRAWDTRHPNVELMYDDGQRRCVCCGWPKLKLMPKESFTAATAFESYRCQKCKKIMRSRKRKDAKKAKFANTL